MMASSDTGSSTSRAATERSAPAAPMDTPPAENCTEEVGEPPHYFHFHQCGRPAKWLVRDVRTGDPRGVCTQHRKWFDRWGEVIGDAGAPSPTSTQAGPSMSSKEER